MIDTYVPFNSPCLVGNELKYIEQSINNKHLSGNGPFTKECEAILRKSIGCSRVLLTHSCTAALEMAALLAGIVPGDEIIMPSYTFVSTANAFVLRGATPVFVDIRPDTLNIDESLVADAVTCSTRAIVPVHYSGVGCDMHTLRDIAQKHELMVIEDAAQAIGSLFDTRPLGSFGELAALSFHETKNVISGEGGAIIINDTDLVERAEIIQEKGTNRSQYFRGKLDKYSWVDIGSSYLPSELISAFLLAQLEHIDTINARRLSIWQYYHDSFLESEHQGLLRRPVIPDNCRHNGHLYYILLPSPEQRDAVLKGLNRIGVHAIFHYLPLHSSPAGKRYGRPHGALENTENLSARLLRLPIHHALSDVQIEHVCATVKDVILSSTY